MLLAVIFPLCFLLFMIPVPSQLYSLMTIPLQLMVTKISIMLTAAIGIPVFAEGNVLHLPERILEVVEACSGLRSLLSLFVLSLVFGYFSLRSTLLRSILFVSAIPVAILVNVIRVSLIIAAFYYFDFDLTSEAVHTYLGIGVFLLALIIIFAEKGILGHWDQSADKK
jgi:exosortase